MSTAAGLTPSVRVRLSAMFFLQYAIWGIWLFPMATFLSKTAGFTDAQIGDAYAVSAIGCIISPFLIGLVADRYFAGQKTLGILNLIGGVFLYLCSVKAYSVVGGATVPHPGLFKWLMLGHFLCFMPTLSLANAIALRHIDDPGKQFPGIRVLGTVGWIAVGLISLFEKKVSSLLGFQGSIEATNILMKCGAAIAIFSGFFAFILPHTPPAAAGKKVSLGEIVGTQALGLFKDRNFFVFALCSFLVLFPGIFYFTQGNLFLNEVGMKEVMFKQTYGQMFETLFLLAMPFFFARFGVKWMLMAGIITWMVRYAMFAWGAIGWPAEALLYGGIIIHGVCYDFFFVTGQLYTDFKAPREMRASAQGLIFLITYGLGWFFASKLAGQIVGKYALLDKAGKLLGHDWKTIWMFPIAMAFGILVIFLLFFHDNARVGQEAPETAAEPAEAEKAAV